MTEIGDLKHGAVLNPKVQHPDRFHVLPLLTEPELVGAAEIAMELLRCADEKAVKATYNLLAHSNRIPAHKDSGVWRLYPSNLRAVRWSEARKAFPTEEQELLVRLHLLLSAIRPLLIAICAEDLNEREALALAHSVDEADLVIGRLLRLPPS